MSKKRNNLGRSVPLCVYCQERPGTTKDHVVPKAIYVPPYPSDLMTVPACEVCNNDEKSKGDADLRDYLVLDKDGTTHPVAQQILWGRFRRSVEQGHSRIATYVATATRQPQVTRNGIFLGNELTAAINDRYIIRTLSMLVRGLSLKAGKQRIPPDYAINVRRVRNYQKKNIAARVAATAPLQYIEQDDFRFEAAYLRGTVDPVPSHWLLLFYDRVMFIALVTGSQAAAHNENETEIPDALLAGTKTG